MITVTRRSGAEHEVGTTKTEARNGAAGEERLVFYARMAYPATVSPYMNLDARLTSSMPSSSPFTTPQLPGRISVFMPTYRCRAWLPRAIRSVLAQTHSSVDLYVVDDASGDVDDDLVAAFPAVSFLRRTTNGGPYQIDNYLLRCTDSEYVAFHDADDWSHPRRFAAQVDLIERHGMDGCGTWSVTVDASGDPIGFETFPPDPRAAIERGEMHPMRHPTGLYRRAVFERLIGFDGSTSFGADTELMYRAFLAFEVGNVQRFLYRHVLHPHSLTQHPSTGIGSDRRKAYSEPVQETIQRVLDGTQTPPEPGRLLTGGPAGVPWARDVDVVQIGRDATSWVGLPAPHDDPSHDAAPHDGSSDGSSSRASSPAAAVAGASGSKSEA